MINWLWIYSADCYITCWIIVTIIRKRNCYFQIISYFSPRAIQHLLHILEYVRTCAWAYVTWVLFHLQYSRVCQSLFDYVSNPKFFGKRKVPNLCGSGQSMPLFSVFSYSVILVFFMTYFWTSKSCQIRGFWPLLDAKLMIFLEGFIYQTCWEIGKLSFIDCFLLLLVLVYVKRMSCTPISLHYSSLHLNKILLLSRRKDSKFLKDK